MMREKKPCCLPRVLIALPVSARDLCNYRVGGLCDIEGTETLQPLCLMFFIPIRSKAVVRSTELNVLLFL